MVILKELFENVDFEKTTTAFQNYQMTITMHSGASNHSTSLHISSKERDKIMTGSQTVVTQI